MFSGETAVGLDTSIVGAIAAAVIHRVVLTKVDHILAPVGVDE